MRDLTSGSLPKLIVMLAAPAMLDVSMSAIAMLMDAFWMGKVGPTALASVAMGTTLRIVLISPMMGLSTGGMAVVARHLGAREQRQADHTVMQAVLLVAIFAVPIAIIGQLFAPIFLRWMGAEGDVARDAMAYLRIVFAGLFFMECLPTINGVIRGAGHPEYTLRISMVNVIVLTLVEPVFALGLGPIPAMGVRGAAIASVAGAFAGVVAQYVTLRGNKSGVSLHRQDLRIDRETMGRILKVALPASAQRFSPNLANALLMRLVAAQGTVVLAAYSLMSRLGGILQASSRGAGSASAALVGQNLGAGLPERAERATRLSSMGAMALTALIYGVVNLWPAQTLGIFGQSGAEIQVGIVLLRWYAIYAIGLTGLEVVGQALCGAGDTVSPLIVNVGAVWLLQLPLGWLLSQHFGWGAQGIWISLVVGSIVGAVAIYGYFHAGGWRRVRI